MPNRQFIEELAARPEMAAELIEKAEISVESRQIERVVLVDQLVAANAIIDHIFTEPHSSRNCAYLLSEAMDYRKRFPKIPVTLPSGGGRDEDGGKE